jgi:endoglucanase
MATSLSPLSATSVLGLLAAAMWLAPAALAATPGFRHGVNIANWLSQNGAELPYGAPWFDEEDVAWIAAQGFDHIRYPIDSRLWLKPDGTLDEATVAPFDRALAWTRQHGLGAILDVHFLDGADFNSGAASDIRVFTNPALMDRAAHLWRLLATRYAKEGDYLRFEILNEPKAETNAQLNVFNFRMLAAIRESNPTRVVYFPVNKWNTIPNVVDLELPAGDPNVAVTVHFYEPMVFTHQRAPWVYSPHSVKNMPAVPFPGKVPDLRDTGDRDQPNPKQSGVELSVAKNIEPLFGQLAQWAKTKGTGREILLGEFGVFHRVDPASTINWTRAVRQVCERHGFGWTVWAYQGVFPVRQWNGKPAPMLEGLFRD